MRFVIKNPVEGYFTEMEVKSMREVTLNGAIIGHENIYAPLFEAFRPKQAIHFDTESDAQEAISKNPVQYGGAEAFSGCTVEPTET